ncbi:L-carnitine dehydratase/bile acid-inducible protein F [Actinobacteria bacterium OK074]|nr:L-carnitine dehydratase/bile acid-inducible protein F [Actinobacteria bacterium OK074]
MTDPNTESTWATLGGDPSLGSRVSAVVREGTLPARLPVRELARTCVAVCALAGAELTARRTGGGVPAVEVDDGAVAAAFRSERQLLVDGRAPVTFAPLSRFWRTADGWVRTHANYPHHRSRLLGVLGLAPDASAEAVAARIATRASLDVEESVYAAGGLTVALRTPTEWAAHEQARELAARPLVERERLDGAPARRLAPLPGSGSGNASGGMPGSAPGSPLLPASGLRVLDLTRVISGPVATRTLALLGADVLRVDSPLLPELPDQHADLDFGKRSTTLDLTARADHRTFGELLAGADVVVTGYRPGALDRFGLTPGALAERRPGLVVAQVSAWGAYGPWGGRRGFDSLVQVATGIAVAEGSPQEPGALPAQALDHGSGYLMAAAVLRALTDQAEEGGTRLVRLALARTAAWLTGGSAQAAAVAPDGPRETAAYDGPGPWLTETKSELGLLRHALPPVRFAGGPLNWACPPGPWGGDAARWTSSP